MHVEIEIDPVGSFNDNTLAGMAGLGGRYSFDAFSVFAEYRHHGVFDNAEFEYLGFPFGADIQGDIFLIGAGFSF